MVWYSAAASIASLLIVGTVFLQIYDFNPGKTHEMLDEDTFRVATPSEQAESMPAGEDLDESIEKTVDESVGEVSAREVSIPAERRDAKGPANATRVQDAEAPVEMAPSPGVQVEEALPRKAEYDPIIHKEAEAVTLEEMEPASRTGRRSDRRSEQLSQPAEAPPMEMQKKSSLKADYAQSVSRQVSGVVISGEDMEPLPGASVAVKGSPTGVVTNMKGIFTLPVQDDSNRTIVASFLGMETQEYQFDDESPIKLVLQPDVLTRDEVVLADQGIQPYAIPVEGYTTEQMKEQEEMGSGPAQPSGGFKAFKQYVEENIQYPVVESPAERAVVILRFTVKPSGDILNIMPLRSPGEPFTQEALRLIKDGPSWEPAFNGDGNIEETVRLRIVFKK